MATYSQPPANKRQKTTRDPVKAVEVNEYFPGIHKIEFKGELVSFDDTLCYRYYNANERIHGRTMEDWIRPAISFTAFRSNGCDAFGKPTIQRSWDDRSQSIENYKRYIKAGFEFCTKLGVKHWTAYDRDLTPEMDTLDENNVYVDEISEFIQELQQRNGLKPLWIAPDLHTSPKYASGAGTSYDSNIMMQAAQQIKKSLELAHKISSDCYLISSVREGYSSVLNTDIQREIKHFARLLKMTSDYKDRLGYRGQLLLQSCRKHETENWMCNGSTENSARFNDQYCVNNNDGMPYSYCWDATSSLCFLKHYSLDRQYKLSVIPNHQFYISNAYNATGSLELYQHNLLDVKDATLIMKNIIEQGGIQPGGINIRIIPCRESVEPKDLFVAYVNCVDMLAKGLKISAKMLSDQTFSKNLQQRYITYYSGFGSRLSNGEASLEECEEQVRKLQGQYPENISSARCEHWEIAFRNFTNKHT